MNVTVRIPDDLATRLSASGADLERRALEGLALAVWSSAVLSPRASFAARGLSGSIRTRARKTQAAVSVSLFHQRHQLSRVERTHTVSRFFQPNPSVGMMFSAVFGIALVWASAPLVKRGTQRIDRAFFRSALRLLHVLPRRIVQAETRAASRTDLLLPDHRSRWRMACVAMVRYARRCLRCARACAGGAGQLNCLRSVHGTLLSIVISLNATDFRGVYPLLIAEGSVVRSKLSAG